MSRESDPSPERPEEIFSELANITTSLRDKLARLRQVTQTLQGTQALSQLAVEFSPVVLRASHASLSAAQFVLELFLSGRTGYGQVEFENESELLSAAPEASAERLNLREVTAQGRLHASSGVYGTEGEISNYVQPPEPRQFDRDTAQGGRTIERHSVQAGKAHRLRFTEAEDAIFSEVYHELAPTIRSKVQIAKEVQARLPNGHERKGNVVYKHLLLLKEKHNWPNFSKNEASAPNGADDDGQVYLNEAVVSVRETHSDDPGNPLRGPSLRKLPSPKSGKLGGSWHL